MGTKMAPAYANTFMAELEQSFLFSQTKQPLLWKRYIDDIFVIWNHSTTDLKSFLSSLNQLHPTIKFTHESSPLQVTFLDITIYKSPDKSHLQYHTHFKPTNKFQYLHFSSNYPNNTHKGLIGELKRFHRTTTDPEKLEQITLDFKQHLKNRGYPLPLIENLTSRPLNEHKKKETIQLSSPSYFIYSKHKTTHLDLKRKLGHHPEPSTLISHLPRSTLYIVQKIKNSC